MTVAATGEKIEQLSAYVSKVYIFIGIFMSLECPTAGLGDGYVKVWQLKKKEARAYKPTNFQIKQQVTCVGYNSTFDLIGASTNQGYINVFANNKNQTTNTTTAQNEISFFKSSDAYINQFKFSPLMESIFATAQEDGIISLYDINNGNNPTTQFTTHKTGVRGIAFSPLNKLLLSSVSLDKQIIFYDITKNKKVSAIVTPEPLQCISFNSDGHTVAVGAINSGNIHVYDLRNQSQVLVTLQGHSSTVNSVSFRWAENQKPVVASQKGEVIVNISTGQGSTTSSNHPKSNIVSPKQGNNNMIDKPIMNSSSTTTQFKTMDQIREEAKKNVELKKQQKEQQRLIMQKQLENDTQMTEIQRDKSSDVPKSNVNQLITEQAVGRLKMEVNKSPTAQQNATLINQLKQNIPSYQPKLGMNIQVEDVEMKEEFNLRIKDRQESKKEENEDFQKEMQLQDKQKTEIDQIIQSKFDQLRYEVNGMLNNFQIEIIRQFELQRNQVDAVVSEYFIDNDGDESEEDEVFALELERKYLRQDDDEDDEEFSNQYLQ
ncbi:UNKNOWN [Stylonychia lemnae]|uniref:Uncharacterized protein n=1 Tax=Stylonychia lemnae TaxID=5949 RepID=A0A078BE79_STYLE|nr:UNKNOWN [Stylonychia lemnae]|eukprot:CDW91863.1 UNKNOWN [Stylonychia lemnae]